jgi:hypothetical protein
MGLVYPKTIPIPAAHGMRNEVIVGSERAQRRVSRGKNANASMLKDPYVKEGQELLSKCVLPERRM